MTEEHGRRATRDSDAQALGARERAQESVAIARRVYGLTQALRAGDGLRPVIELTQLVAQVMLTSMDGYEQVFRDAARSEQRARSILAHHERALKSTR